MNFWFSHILILDILMFKMLWNSYITSFSKHAVIHLIFEEHMVTILNNKLSFNLHLWMSWKYDPKQYSQKNPWCSNHNHSTTFLERLQRPKTMCWLVSARNIYGLFRSLSPNASSWEKGSCHIRIRTILRWSELIEIVPWGNVELNRVAVWLDHCGFYYGLRKWCNTRSNTNFPEHLSSTHLEDNWKKLPLVILQLA